MPYAGLKPFVRRWLTKGSLLRIKLSHMRRVNLLLPLEKRLLKRAEKPEKKSRISF